MTSSCFFLSTLNCDARSTTHQINRGIVSRWRRDFPHPSRPGLWPSQPPIQWVLDHYRGQSCRGVTLRTNNHVAPRLKKEYNHTSNPSLSLHGMLQAELYPFLHYYVLTLLGRRLYISINDILLYIRTQQITWFLLVKKKIGPYQMRKLLDRFCPL